MEMQAMTVEQVAQEQRSFMFKVYGWMTLALGVTALVASYVAETPALWKVILGNQFLFFGLIIGELVLVGGLAGWASKMSGAMATIVFLVYSALNGLTLSVIFLAFTAGSLGITFFVTAGTFGITCAVGYFTKTDLSSVGGFALMSLIGLILASVVNWWMQSTMLYWITTYAGILIFVCLTAYDAQKIRRMNIIGNAGTDEDRKEAIMGALALYLDFINLFLLLLRIFGRRR
ncbi:MAG: Bax inhibitor-1/YccA family protein [Lentisphaerota bacterium]